MRFRVEFENPPTDWSEAGEIKLTWQSRVRPQEFDYRKEAAWEIQVDVKDGRWSGPSVGKNPDGRRFIYFAWLDTTGRIIRRIKLYQDQVIGEIVRLDPRMPDGSPACSTARLRLD